MNFVMRFIISCYLLLDLGLLICYKTTDRTPGFSDFVNVCKPTGVISQTDSSTLGPFVLCSNFSCSC